MAAFSSTAFRALAAPATSSGRAPRAALRVPALRQTARRSVDCAYKAKDSPEFSDPFAASLNDDDWTDVSMVDISVPFDHVKQYMSSFDLQVAAPDDDLRTVIQSLERAFRVPVVAEDNTLVGMISRRDIARLQQEGVLNIKGKVQDVMVPPVYVDIACHVADAAALMIDHKLHSVPVVNKDLKLKGMLSKIDIFAPSTQAMKMIMSPEYSAETMRDVACMQSWGGDLDDAMEGPCGVAYQVVYDGHDRHCRALVHMLSLRDHGQLLFVDSRGFGYDHRQHHGITPRNNVHRIHAIDNDGEIVSGIEAVKMLYELLGMQTEAQAAKNAAVGSAAEFMMKLPDALRKVAHIQGLEEVALYKHFLDQGKRGFYPA